MNNHLTNLRWDTKAANRADMIRHGRSTKGERSVNAKLNHLQVKAIMWLLAYGDFTTVEIASLFGISRQLVSAIRGGKVWKHLA